MPSTHEAAAAAATFALVAALGFDEGGYAATAWGWSAFVLFGVLAVVVARGAAAPRRGGLLLVGGLAALLAWTIVSTLWSSHVSATVLEAERLLLYVAAGALFVLARAAAPILAGVLAAVTTLCGYGLARWLLGDPEVPLSADPLAGERLSEPVGYANGVAILAAIGLLLAAGFAATARRPGWAAAAAGPAPVLAVTLYFTYGRGAWLALAVGLCAGVALAQSRLGFAAVALALVPASAVAVGAAATIESERAVAALLPLLCAASAATAFALRSQADRFRFGRRARTAFAAVLVLLPLAVAAAALVRLGGPEGAVDAFKAAPAPVHGEVGARVLNASGSSRADYWSVAWRAYRDEPLYGTGGGTFARVWLVERRVPQPVKDAHSLYLETLAELGPLGLALLVAALAAPLLGGRARWTATALAPYTAFLAHAAQDWDWELPAVVVAALACGGAALSGPSGVRLPRAASAAAAALALLAAVGYAGNRFLAEAVAAADRADYAGSADAARSARRLQSWSGEPWRLLGEAELARGRVNRAHEAFRRGIRRDTADWELWLDLGLATEGADRLRAWERAESLNPLSPELKELGFDSP